MSGHGALTQKIKFQDGVGNVDLGADDSHLLTPAEIGDAK
jgi:hypothetical protein